MFSQTRTVYLWATSVDVLFRRNTRASSLEMPAKRVFIRPIDSEAHLPGIELASRLDVSDRELRHRLRQSHARQHLIVLRFLRFPAKRPGSSAEAPLA